jgi:recombination associated protein RdgC
MGLLSSSVSISQYRVEGKLPDPVIDAVRQGLIANAIGEIDNDPSPLGSGWTSFESPFKPNFEDSHFLIDTAFVFSLRIDKKAIASKVIQKHYSLAVERRLAEEGRDFLSRSEKKMVKENVIGMLSTRIPATPSVYDLVWEYEAGQLWFFSNLKSANEELETLFTRSFKLSLVRLFPYTAADRLGGLSDSEKDRLSQLKPLRLVD